MLGLQRETNPDWIRAANAGLESILMDHAHCEKKAAATALSLVSRYPEDALLVDRLIGLAQEELDHFARIHRILIARSIPLTRDHGDAYARALHDHCRSEEPKRKLDALLVAALIEARSCERFTLLARHCADEELRAVYADLLASEAGHHAMFTDLARREFPPAEVKQRAHELGVIEAAIVEHLPNKPLIHG